LGLTHDKAVEQSVATGSYCIVRGEVVLCNVVHVELNGIWTDLHEDQESHATSIAAEGVHIFGNPADSAIGHYQTVLPHDLVSTLALSVDFNGSLVDY